MGVKVLVSVDTERPGSVASVAAKLRSAGVEVSEVLEEIGTIVASCPESRLAEIAGIDGVLNVERSRDIGIPPPSSPVQ